MADALPVVETDVEIRTKDGVCDAAFIHPAAGAHLGAHPGVLIWADALGLRPAMREMGKRLAAEGYSVLVPNPFYRSAKAPVFDGSFSFQNPADMARFHALRAPLSAPGAAESDAVAFVEFLDAQAQVDKGRKIGSHGYCMGGPLAVKTAAAQPERVGAAASFHGGGLATDKPDSPHLLAPKIRARMYFGIAADDDAREPQAKDKLREAFPEAGIEVYPGTLHGWCMPDMPLKDGKPVYSEPDAERAWDKLLELYREAIA